MRMRITASIVVVALAVAGVGYLSNWWQPRSIVGVVSGPDRPESESGVGVGTQDLDRQALKDAETAEDFKTVPGLRFDSAEPTPSSWRR